MNWIGRLRSYVGVGILLLLTFVLGGLFPRGFKNSGRLKESNLPAVQTGAVLGNAEEKANNSDRKLKKIKYEELSPDGAQKVIKYKMVFDEQLYDDYYNEFFINQKIIAVEDIKTSKEYYVFTGEERTGDPHWLGDDYIFFTTNCGTSCQGLYLVDVRNKESELAVISYVFNGDGLWMTHFKDWFGEKFIFKGLVDKITSLTVGDESYLILKMKDINKNPLGEERLLFTGDSLKDVIE